MNCFIFLASLVIAAAPPPPTPDWGQLTPGVDYSTSSIGIQLSLDDSYRMIDAWYANGQVLTQTGIASLDALGQQFGVTEVRPASRANARKIAIARIMGKAEFDSQPLVSGFWTLLFSTPADVPIVSAAYQADQNVLLTEITPIIVPEGNLIPAVTPDAVTQKPTAAPVARLDPSQPQPGQVTAQQPRPTLVLVALGACACLAVALAVSTIVIIVVVRSRRKKP